MQTIGNHGLFCPDPQDYAAVALYMQALGEQIDAELAEQLAALEGFLSRPTAILTNAANVNIPALSASSSVYTTFAFNNAPTIIQTQVVGSITYMTLGDPAGTVNPVTYPRGAWRFGAIARMQATGALDGFTTRTLRITITDDVLGSTIHGVQDNTYATSAGAPDAVNLTTTELLTGTHGVRVRATASHTNSSSSVDVLAGGLFWATYEGPTDIIEVA